MPLARRLRPLAPLVAVTTGRNGHALAFNGTNSMVSVPDSNSLDVTAVHTHGERNEGVGLSGADPLSAKENPRSCHCEARPARCTGCSAPNVGVIKC